METTLIIDPEQLKDAQELTGVSDTATVIRMALDDLIQKQVAKRLIALGGSDPNATAPPRRRF